MKISEILTIYKPKIIKEDISFYKEIDKTITSEIDKIRKIEEILNENNWEIFNETGNRKYFKKSKENYILIVYFKDSCFRNFINFSLKNQSNIHLPKIYNHYIFRANDDIGIVEMEKLDNVREVDIDDLNFLAWLYLYMKEKKYATMFSEYNLRNVEDFSKVKKLADSWHSANPALARTIETLKRLFANCPFEYTPNNIKRRGNEWVLTSIH